jgi:hypothetical protein
MAGNKGCEGGRLGILLSMDVSLFGGDANKTLAERGWGALKRFASGDFIGVGIRNFPYGLGVSRTCFLPRKNPLALCILSFK